MKRLLTHMVLLVCAPGIFLRAQTVPWVAPAVSAVSVPLEINCIPQVDGSWLKKGDYIGVFSSNGKCFGLARWNDSTGFRISVYGNDGNVDGFQPGDPLNLKIWLYEENCVLEQVESVQSDSPLVYSNTLANRVNVLNFARLSVVYPRLEVCRNTEVLKPVLGYAATGLGFSSGTGLAVDATTGAVSPFASQPGHYSIRLTAPVCLRQKIAELTINPEPDIIPMPDTAICGEVLTLTTPSGYATVTWSTGATAGLVELRQSGNVWYRVTDQKGCSNTDTFSVVKTILERVDYVIDPADCERPGRLRITDQEVSNGRPPYAFRLTNRVNNSTTDSFEDLTEGVYVLEVINSNGCVLKYAQGLVIRKDCLEDTPVFSPNDDGLDDRFFIEAEGAVKIFDRSGTLRRKLTGPVYFDGRDERGDLLPMGTYLIVPEKGGTVTLTIVR